jgi:hypothetical protein
VKAADVRAKTFALAGGFGGAEQVLEADQMVPEVADPFHAFGGQ